VYENRVLGDYLDLNGRQEIMYEENSILKIFTISSFHHILSG